MNISEQRTYSNRSQTSVNWVCGDDPSVLPHIYDDPVNITILERQLTENVCNFAKSLCVKKPAFSLKRVLETQGVNQSLEDLLPNLANRDHFIQDLSLLIDMYSCLFELEEVGVRLQATDRAMCPRFHVDRLGCRLVTTYNGPGTEWLPNHCIDRSKLGPGSQGKTDLESGLFTSESDIYQANCGDVLLLKGEGWSRNEGGGAVHRSPMVKSEETRLVLTIDFA